MSMNLSPENLQKIASVVREMDSLGVDVKMIEVAEHDVILQKVNGQHLIRGITNKKNGGLATR
jgi:hypothetical protein